METLGREIPGKKGNLSLVPWFGNWTLSNTIAAQQSGLPIHGLEVRDTDTFPQVSVS